MESNEIKKAIIPIAGLGTRFLPLSKALSKEFFPLVDKPIIQHIVEEMRDSGIKEIVFVVSPQQKTILNYFKRSTELEKLLIKRKKENILNELKEFHEQFKDISFSYVVQEKPNGDGHAIVQGLKLQKQETVATSFGDDVFYSETPAIAQLISIYKTCNAPVVGLKRVPRDKVPAYGTVLAEKIANNLYKVKKIVEKPKPEEVLSDLVIVGKHILTPDVFSYLRKAKPSARGEIILTEVLAKMLDEGKTIYGYELKGEWLECGDKSKWLKSFFYMSLKDQKYGPELKEYLKMIK